MGVTRSLASWGLLAAMSAGLAGCGSMQSAPPAPVASGNAATIVGSKNPSPGTWAPDSFVFVTAIDGQRAQDGYREWAFRQSASPGAHVLDVGLAERTFMGGDEARAKLNVTVAAGQNYRLRASEPDPAAPSAPVLVWLENSRGEPVSERVSIALRAPVAGTPATAAASPSSRIVTPERSTQIRPAGRIGSPMATY